MGHIRSDYNKCSIILAVITLCGFHCTIQLILSLVEILTSHQQQQQKHFEFCSLKKYKLQHLSMLTLKNFTLTRTTSTTKTS